MKRASCIPNTVIVKKGKYLIYSQLAKSSWRANISFATSQNVYTEERVRDTNTLEKRRSTQSKSIQNHIEMRCDAIFVLFFCWFSPSIKPLISLVFCVVFVFGQKECQTFDIKFFIGNSKRDFLCLFICLAVDFFCYWPNKRTKGRIWMSQFFFVFFIF